MPTDVESRTRTDRRARFREYMQKLNPTAPAQSVIDSGLALKDLHGSLYKVMAARADLDPGSQQILVGGIGSGKTTELLLTQRWLTDEFRSSALYIDISSETDLTGVNSGALLASFGQHMSRLVVTTGLGDTLSQEKRSALESMQKELDLFAFGKTEKRWIPDDYEQEPDEPGQYITFQTPGKLQPLFPPLQRDIREIQNNLTFFLDIFRENEIDLAVIFDGLDRLGDPEKFWAMAHQDLKVMRSLSIAVVSSAPISVLYGSNRQIAEEFDRVHHIPAVQYDPKRPDKLHSVLTQRGTGKLAHEAEIERIAHLSGGVLRDLITLARDAGEAAYLDLSEGVEARHVESAAKQLGGSYRRGLNASQIHTLRQLHSNRVFMASLQANIELLATRRVLEYSATDFQVHPVLEPFI